MKTDNNNVSWKTVVEWVLSDYELIIIGSMLASVTLLGVSWAGVQFFGIMINPINLGITMSVFYTILSIINKSIVAIIYIKESFMYIIATIFLIFFLIP